MAGKVGVSNVRHIKVAGEESTYCGWPWTGGGIYNFGDGELAVVFTEGPCRYEKPEHVDHGPLESRGRQVLRRSLDHGETWPKELEVVIRDNSIPFASLFPNGEIGPHPELKRPQIDMSQPDSMLCAWRWFAGDPRVGPDGAVWYRKVVCFVLRSADKGHTWEVLPNLVPNAGGFMLYGGSNYVKRPNGTLLLATAADMPPSTDDRSVLYGSPDNGVTWHYISTVACREETAGTAYPCIRALADGRIICSVGFRGEDTWTSVAYSADEGHTWTVPRRINRFGDQASLLLLSDARLVCVWGYRLRPYGIRGKVSTDLGETWSEEFVLRDDGGSEDLGYPVLAELDDGRLLAAYYFNVEDGTNLFGGRRFIGGTFFELL